jgi:hypothetical protein
LRRARGANTLLPAGNANKGRRSTVTTITAVAESLGEVGPADQAVAPHLVTAGRRRAGGGWSLAVVVSVGIAEAAWCGMLGWAIWTFVL